MTGGPCDRKVLSIPSSTSAVEEVCQRLLAEAASQGYGCDDLFGIHLAMEEALMNAAKHGNHLDPDKQVVVEYQITPEKFDISVADQGNGFDPEALPDPRQHENLYKYGGRGVLLMRSYMDVVEYSPKGNQVHMVKCRSGAAPDAGR